MSHRLNFFSFSCWIISAHKRDGYHHRAANARTRKQFNCFVSFHNSFSFKVFIIWPLLLGGKSLYPQWPDLSSIVQWQEAQPVNFWKRYFAVAHRTDYHYPVIWGTHCLFIGFLIECGDVFIKTFIRFWIKAPSVKSLSDHNSRVIYLKIIKAGALFLHCISDGTIWPSQCVPC